MKKFIYRLAFFVTIITFITNVMNGITLYTSLIRSVIVFMIMLFLSVITLKIIHWTLMLNKNKPKEEIVKTEKE